MDAAALRQRFSVPGVTFEDANGLTRVEVATKAATATVYIQGAHLTAWQPAGFESAILLSHKSEFAPGKPIRGGIPIVFPWFAGDRKQDRIDGHPGPSHGFARIQDWTLETVQLIHDTMHLGFTLGPTDMSRAMGYANFTLKLEFSIGHELQMAMTVTNTGKEAVNYEEAFHTYFEVADIHEVSIDGLQPTSFIDKTDAMQVKPAEHEPIRFTQTLDRVYNHTSAGCTIHDVAGRRAINLQKTGSNTTVVWNPFGPLADLGEWDWHSMCAVEVANAGVNAITLASGESRSMTQNVELTKI